jgi:hypothetical protein
MQSESNVKKYCFITVGHYSYVGGFVKNVKTKSSKQCGGLMG